MTTTTPLRKPLLTVAIVVVLLLAVPAVAMRYTPDVAWGPGDFVAAGVLLYGVGALMVLGLRQVRGAGARVAAVAGVAVGVALVWAELAVGLFS